MSEGCYDNNSDEFQSATNSSNEEGDEEWRSTYSIVKHSSNDDGHNEWLLDKIRKLTPTKSESTPQPSGAASGEKEPAEDDPKKSSSEKMGSNSNKLQPNYSQFMKQLITDEKPQDEITVRRLDLEIGDSAEQPQPAASQDYPVPKSPTEVTHDIGDSTKQQQQTAQASPSRPKSPTKLKQAVGDSAKERPHTAQAFPRPKSPTKFRQAVGDSAKERPHTAQAFPRPKSPTKVRQAVVNSAQASPRPRSPTKLKQEDGDSHLPYVSPRLRNIKLQEHIRKLERVNQEIDTDIFGLEQMTEKSVEALNLSPGIGYSLKRHPPVFKVSPHRKRSLEELNEMARYKYMSPKERNLKLQEKSMLLEEQIEEKNVRISELGGQPQKYEKYTETPKTRPREVVLQKDVPRDLKVGFATVSVSPKPKSPAAAVVKLSPRKKIPPKVEFDAVELSPEPKPPAAVVKLSPRKKIPPKVEFDAIDLPSYQPPRLRTSKLRLEMTKLEQSIQEKDTQISELEKKSRRYEISAEILNDQLREVKQVKSRSNDSDNPAVILLLILILILLLAQVLISAIY